MSTDYKHRLAQILKQITQIKKEPKDIVGVDIAEGQITVVVLETAPTYKVGKVEDIVVKKITSAPADEEICKIIEEIFREKHLFKKGVWLNIDLPAQAINFGRVFLPVMPDIELPNAIRWSLKDKLPLDIKEVQLGYRVICESQKEDGSKGLDIMAVLVEKGTIDKFLNIFNKLGIVLLGINVTPFSISNLLDVDKELSSEETPILVCHIGIEYSYICIYVEGKLDFVRQIPLAQRSFLSAMTGVLISDKGRMELTSKDAQEIIERFGIPKETDAILDGKISSNQIIAMVRPMVEQFTEEVLRSIEYYQGEFKKRVERVLLTGEGSQIKGLSDFLSKGLNLNVEYLRLPMGLLCGAAIGAAKGYKGGINLLPVELKQKRHEEIKKTAVRLSTVAILGVLFFSFLSVTIQITSYKKQLELIRNQRLILKDLKALRDRITSRMAVICSMREKETSGDLILKELSAITPGNVALSGLWLNQKQKQLKLRGMVSAKAQTVQGLLSDFTEALEKSLFIKEANLSNLEKRDSLSGEFSIFEINCALR